MANFTIDHGQDEELKVHNEPVRQIISPIFLDMSGGVIDNESSKKEANSMLLVENCNFGSEEHKEYEIGIVIEGNTPHDNGRSVLIIENTPSLSSSHLLQ